jgi:hypothetical protein
MHPSFKGLDPHKLGTHKFPFVAALRCKEAGLTEEQAEQLIEAEEHLMPRYFKPEEVWEAVCSAYGSANTAHRKWPQVDRAKRRPIISQGGGLRTLQHCSQSEESSDARLTEDIIDLLFPGNPLLCAGQSVRVFSTKERDKWRGRLSDRQFIVPSPMSTPTGLTKDGRESAKSDDNTGDRRFLVIEQDKIDGKDIPRDEQEAVLVHLSTRLPLVLAVSSGGKSVHGWFLCEGAVESDLREFMEYAVSLGADSATWTKSQFVRMPDGTRQNGNRQEILYFNPSLLK